MIFGLKSNTAKANCPPESGGQHDRRSCEGWFQGGYPKNGPFGTTPALRATPPDSGACPSNAMGPHLESEIVKKGHGKDIPRMDP